MQRKKKKKKKSEYVKEVENNRIIKRLNKMNTKEKDRNETHSLTFIMSLLFFFFCKNKITDLNLLEK